VRLFYKNPVHTVPSHNGRSLIVRLTVAAQSLDLKTFEWRIVEQISSSYPTQIFPFPSRDSNYAVKYSGKSVIGGEKDVEENVKNI